MRERDVLDLGLVVLLGVLTYVESFGLADPKATLAEIYAVLVALDVRVYLVLGGIFGMVFVGYITVYLPKRDAKTRSPR